jgi:hypothetical protein
MARDATVGDQGLDLAVEIDFTVYATSQGENKQYGTRDLRHKSCTICKSEQNQSQSTACEQIHFLIGQKRGLFVPNWLFTKFGERGLLVSCQQK